MQEGISHRVINTIYLDSRGLIWLGTRYGLNRFDGYEFDWVTKEKDGLTNIDIVGINEDAEGNLWLFPALQKAGGFSNIDLYSPVSKQVTSLEDKFGGDLPFHLNDLTGFPMSDSERTLYFGLENGRLVTYHSGHGFSVVSVKNTSSLLLGAVTSRNTVWAIADNHRLLELDKQGNILQEFRHDFPIFFNQYPAQAGSAFLYQEKRADGSWRLFLINADGKRLALSNSDAIYKWAYDPSRPKVVHLHPSNHTIWIEGKIYHPEEGLLFDLEKDYPGKYGGQKAFLFDNMGRAWMGNENGLLAVNVYPKRFSHYLYHPSGSNYTSTRGLVIQDEMLYFNNEITGFGLLDFESGKSTTIRKREEVTSYTALAKGVNGTLWFSEAKNLLNYQPADGTIREFGWVNPEAVFRIWTIYEDEKHQIWLGGEKGLAILPPSQQFIQKFDTSDNFPELQSATVLYIGPDRAGNLWACTNRGFYQLKSKPGVTGRYWTGGKASNYLPHDNIQHFYQDKEGVFWLATNGGGLIKWNRDANNYRQFTRSDGLPRNDLYAVYEDDNRQLWMSSLYRIIQFDKTTFQIKTYLPDDGINSAEFNRTSHYQSGNGTILFGGKNGIVAFDPDDFVKPDVTRNTPLIITDYIQFDRESEKPVELTNNLLEKKEILLRPGDRIIRIEFALLSYQNPEENLYAYKIEGLDKDWNFQKERSIIIGQIPYGEHQLLIKGQTIDGRGSEQEIQIKLIVLRPFYLQLWFILVAVAMLIILMSAVYSYRIKQLSAQKARLEDEVYKRTETIRLQNQQLSARAEDLLRLDELKNRFFANITHELRTPLTLILSPFKSILNSKELSKQNTRLLKNARQNGRNLLLLINDILDFSKLESGKIDLKYEPVLLCSFLKRVVASFESHAQKRGIQLHFETQTGRDLAVMLDEKKVETVINNLISNALKFTRKGGSISVLLEEHEQHLILKVKDTGRGIHPDDLPNIFNRYYQSNLPNAPTEGGTGIGLALSKEYAELLQGRLWAESPIYGLESQGSTFYFEFPKKEVSGLALFENGPIDTGIIEEEIENSYLENLLNEGMSVNLAITTQVQTGGATATVLIVEDNYDLREYLQLLLKNNYKVLLATDGVSALEILMAKGQPASVDLIISDIMMPVMDGFQLLDRLKTDDHLRHLPIIMLTARSGIKDRLKALRTGVDDYLLKPFEPEELLARIQNLLKNRQARQAITPEPRILTSSFLQNEVESLASLTQQPFAEDIIWLEQLENLIRQEVRNDLLSVSWIAKQLSVSERHLLRRLKSLTGLTPNQYIKEVRIQEARRLLEERLYKTVKEVAFAVSFRDEKYFSLVFKERFGKYPSEYQI